MSNEVIVKKANSFGRFFLLGGAFAIFTTAVILWLIETGSYLISLEFYQSVKDLLQGWPIITIFSVLWVVFGTIFVLKLRSKVWDYTLLIAILVICGGLKFTASESNSTVVNNNN